MSVEEISTILSGISQAGATGMLAIALYFLWREFRVMIAFLRELLLEYVAHELTLDSDAGTTQGGQDSSAQKAAPGDHLSRRVAGNETVDGGMDRAGKS